MKKTLRLILGDQLNYNHSWFSSVNQNVTYVMMEIRTETDYVKHHIQKVVGIFAAMRNFANELKSNNHKLIYLYLNDKENLQSFSENIKKLISIYQFTNFEYQFPDEFRVDQELKLLCKAISISSNSVDSEHFYTSRSELSELFYGKKTYLMESFYRSMRKKHNLLMNGEKPMNDQWNFDTENRKKLPKNHKPIAPLVFNNNVSDILLEIKKTDIQTIGSIDPNYFIWPINRKQSLELLDFFATDCLSLFGSFQDAMSINEWSLYHSRISFSMNIKLITPKEVIDRVIQEWNRRPTEIEFHQLEGFVRQIVGWREYMRGIYWSQMPDFAGLNYLENKNKLPNWFWSGNTKMNCLKEAINHSLKYGYAHHIQRLMITGNFALLAGVHPDEIDSWYLGIYIDAFEWVQITNTRGMSQYADGGIVGSKPYVSSASYIDKMSNYCASCYYNKNIKTGDKACPFNSLYWNFYHINESKLSSNPRIGMMYNVWRKMNLTDKTSLLEQANYYLNNINEL